MMYMEHPVCEKPEDEHVKIWRYMDFTKFVSLLSKRKLFFVRAGRLADDPYEGAFPRQHPNPIYHKITGYIADTVHHTDVVAVNCWHINQYESAAMWKLYLKSNEGVAIQSKFSRLTQCFNETSREVYIGKVKYIDYETDIIGSDFGNMLTYLLHKRPSFEHEQELRASVIIPPSSSSPLSAMPPQYLENLTQSNLAPHDGDEIIEDGIYVPVDLDTLIERVYIPPRSQEWYVALVESVMNVFNLEKKIERSDLDQGPRY